jgi:hypothetical protein
MEVCTREEPPLIEIHEDHRVACHLWMKLMPKDT